MKKYNFLKKKLYNRKASNIPRMLIKTGKSLKNKGAYSESTIFKFIGKIKIELFQKPLPTPISKSFNE